MGDQSDTDVHVYRVASRNKAGGVVASVAVFCLGVFAHYHRLRHGQSTTAALKGDLAVLLPLFGLALFFAIRIFQMRLTITKSQIEVVNPFRSYTIPFAEIRGRREGKGIYLYRRGESRVWVNDRSFRTDDFYTRWKASIYDLDKADVHERKLAGKPRTMDWFFDDSEQHPAIGGPDSGC